MTEATALLLFPVAFLGLAFALYEDAYPKVTMLIDHLPARLRPLSPTGQLSPGPRGAGTCGGG